MASQSSNEVLLRTEAGTFVPNVRPDGRTFLWTIEGQYLYGLKVAPGADDDLPPGGLPPHTNAASEFTLAQGDFVEAIVSQG